MQQLSRPYQIALVALLLFAAAWFTVLKPSDPVEAVVPPPAVAGIPGATGLGTAVEKAEGAAATSAAASAAAGADPAAPVTPAPGSAAPVDPAAAAPADPPAKDPAVDAEPADPSAPILRDVARGKVAVVLFFSREGAEDRAVRRALLAADRHAGEVVVHAASIARVADYAAITQGVQVLQAPTLLVIGKDNRARPLVGFADTRSIDQLVADVGGPAFAPRRLRGYRARVENLCAILRQSAAGDPLVGPDAADRAGILRADLIDARRVVRTLDPPRRFATFQRRLQADLALGVKAYGGVVAALQSGGDAASALAGDLPRLEASRTRLAAAARRAGLSRGC
jgi:hypothetical protein